ncbi:hypothetical protein [Catenibacterium sp.]|uniref:hypothetical protein n=1 Tax=Catenibacterium sp. TaxID=2049022 RepID=UPI002E78262B|nr:hypothetical protein [Catenibacterium sp.]MEE0042873.1 hypothetical protein [Catenibacterium sp.]
MCWIEIKDNVNVQIADKDFKVYKIVLDASKKLCVSEFTGFTYYKDTEPSELKLALHSNSHSGFLTIKEGYYSYESVNFVLDSLCDPNFHGFICKTIVLGTHKELLGINNSIYLATFIIPKGSIYFVNPLGVIVSSRIKYTVTKVTPSSKSVGIYQFSSDNINFLRYYKVCSQSEWDSAIDRLNVWFKDANLKVGEL